MANEASVLTTAAAVRAGSAAPSDGVEHALASAERVADLNIFTHLDPAGAREASTNDRRAPKDLGALAGVAFVAKDIVDTKDSPVSGGTPALRGRNAPRDAPALSLILEAGARLVGKTNLHELSFGITSNNAAFGPVRNPHDPSRIAGGSSGGSAAAVAAGIVPFAVAGDTGGSSRIPAALCGVVGFRPSMGRYPSDGVVPISPTRDTLGLMARSVSDIRYVDDVIAATPDVRSEGGPVTRRLGRPRCLADLPHDSDVLDRYDLALSQLEDAGWEIVDVDLIDLFTVANEIGLVIALHEFQPALTNYLASSHPDVSFESVGEQVASPDVAGIWGMATDGSIDAAAYADAMDRRSRAQREYEAVLRVAGVEAVAFPTTPVTARAIGEDDTVTVAGEPASTFGTYTRYTNLAGVIGTPGISLPVGSDADGLPIGIEFDGLHGHDQVLLRIAEEVESDLGVP